MPDYQWMDLERLLEERDNLRIRLNLIDHGDSSESADPNQLREELQKLERLIADLRREERTR